MFFLEIESAATGLIAGKPAPTLEMHSPVGAGLSAIAVVAAPKIPGKKKPRIQRGSFQHISPISYP